MSTETRVGQVIDQVLALSRALSGHRAPTGTDSTDGLVTVYDGPEVRTTDDAIDNTFVVIATGGEVNDERRVSAVISLTSGPIASTVRPRDEITQIQCVAVAQRYETMKLARDAAIAEVAVFAALCRSGVNGPNLGIDTSATVGGVRLLAWVTAGQLVQYTDRGFSAEMDFTISYSTRV